MSEGRGTTEKAAVSDTLELSAEEKRALIGLLRRALAEACYPYSRAYAPIKAIVARLEPPLGAGAAGAAAAGDGPQRRPGAAPARQPGFEGPQRDLLLEVDEAMREQNASGIDQLDVGSAVAGLALPGHQLGRAAIGRAAPPGNRRLPAFGTILSRPPAAAAPVHARARVSPCTSRPPRWRGSSAKARSPAARRSRPRPCRR